MKGTCKQICAQYISLLVLISVLCSSNVLADVVRDGSLGSGATNIEPVTGQFVITESHGRLNGSNLFHSFSEFNLDNSQSAIFTADNPVANVISRITGDSASSIDGTISSSISGANLYFINPQGFVFGKNAKIDTLGGFHLSTSDRLNFSEKSGAFEAYSNGNVPLLITAQPVDFGLLHAESGSIEFSGSRLNFSGSDPKIQHNVSIHARNIEMNEFALLDAIVIGSPASGSISLFASENILLNNTNLESKQDISLKANYIELRNNARIKTSTSTSKKGGSITLDATDHILLSDYNTIDGNRHAVLFSESRADGVGGDIQLTAPLVEIKNGAQVTAIALDESSGDAGNIQIDATQGVTITGRYSDSQFINVESQLLTSSAHSVTDSGGNITIKSGGDIIVSKGARIIANTTGSGDAGDITLTANNTLTLDDSIDSNKHILDTDINNREGGVPIDGNAGDINLSAKQINIINGGKIASRTETAGNGGDISLIAEESILLEGTLLSGGTINAAATGIVGDAKAGSILLQAPVILLNKGAKINSGISNNNSGGDIKISASDYLSLSGVNRMGKNAELSANSAPDSEGKTGNIAISAGELRSDAGLITTSTQGEGKGGDIAINATNDISLLNNAKISSNSTQGGDAGNIDVKAKNITLKDSLITTGSRQAGGGNISVTSNRLLHLQNSVIDTNVTSGVGNGGDISIAANFVLLDRSDLLAKADAGQGGAITIEANNYYASLSSVVDASAGPSGTDGRIDITAINAEVEDKLLPLESNFSDISSLLRPSCHSVNSSANNDSHLQITNFVGTPLSPEGMLLAFDNISHESLLLGKNKNDPNEVAIYEAVRAFHKGLYQQAYQHLNNANVSGIQLPGNQQAIKLLGLFAQTQQAMGLYASSVEILSRMITSINSADDPVLAASVLSSLGSAYTALGKFDKAEKTLKQAIAYAHKSNQAQITAVVWNNFGNLRATRQEYLQSITAYHTSAHFARLATDPMLEAKALANKARSALSMNNIDHAAEYLAKAAGLIQTLDESNNKAVILINLAKSYHGLATMSPRWHKDGLLAAITMLSHAVTLSRDTGNADNLVFAYGNAAALYMSENRLDEALYLTRQALNAEKRANPTASLYRWHWQEGRLLWAQGDSNGAVQAHGRAVEVIEQNRQQLLTRFGTSAQYFTQTIAPVYRDYVSVLLQSEKRSKIKTVSQSLLFAARTAIEKFKVAELQDYFRNECIIELAAKSTRLEAVSPTAAVIYPIVLDERLVILVSYSDVIKQYDVNVSRNEFIQTIRRFRFQLEALGKKQHYKQLSHSLYNWLVKPYQYDLARNNIDTLVFVPDGALRTIPLSALNDGHDYIIRQYSVVTSLGLSLTAPRALDADSASVLLAGISKPTQGFEALPLVSKELESIARLFDSKTLLNQDFTLNDFNAALEKPRTIVHIASHARFLPNVEDSFLLTFDDRLSIDQLSLSLLKTKYRQHALELLFLSACQTAANDDRAALGLAGAGVKAGARSAIGSLWDISDNSASRIVTEFYINLKNNKLSKAKALQEAQLALLDDPEFNHPFYWSSFILINNWL